jgi:hypothetical protein
MTVCASRFYAVYHRVGIKKWRVELLEKRRCSIRHSELHNFRFNKVLIKSTIKTLLNLKCNYAAYAASPFLKKFNPDMRFCIL